MVSITNVIIKFLGSAYLLLGFLLFLIKSISGKKLIAAIIAFNIFGFVNLYLLLLFNELIHLPTIYFTFQALLQICLIIALIEKTNFDIPYVKMKQFNKAHYSLYLGVFSDLGYVIDRQTNQDNTLSTYQHINII